MTFNTKKRLIYMVGTILTLASLISYFYIPSIKPLKNKKPLINSQCLLSDTSNYVTSLKELNGKLIFFFSQYNCLPCVTQQLTIIKQTEPYLNPDKLVIVTDFKHSKDLKIFNENYNLSFNTYITNERLLQKEEVFPAIPFFLIFDQNLHTNELFLCHDTSGEKTITFLEKFKDNYE